MARGVQIDAQTRTKIVEAYLANDDLSYADIAERFGVSVNTVAKFVKAELQAGNGIKPERRAKPEPPSDWMQHITPLHKHKQALELAVEHKQAELDKARQELRDFTATLRQLMGDTA